MRMEQAADFEPPEQTIRNWGFEASAAVYLARTEWLSKGDNTRKCKLDEQTPRISRRIVHQLHN